MRRILGTTALLLAATLPLACEGSTGPDDRLSVTVLGTTFERGDGGLAQVPWRLVNMSSRTLSLSSCGDWPHPIIDRWTGTRWEQHSGGFCIQDAIFAPVELEPGEELQGATPLLEAGRFRLRFGIAEEGRAPTWKAASKGFEVE